MSSKSQKSLTPNSKKRNTQEIILEKALSEMPILVSNVSQPAKNTQATPAQKTAP